MKKAIDIILKTCLGLKKDESLLIIFDENKRKIADVFYNKAKGYSDNVKVLNIPIGRINGEEPPHYAKELMLKYDVQLLITTMSLTHTKARINASKKGARIVSMPDITKEIIERCIDIDYGNMFELNKKIADKIDKGNKVRVMTEKGTDIEFSIKDRDAYGRTGGRFLEKGKYGNLPDGEVFLAPIEGSANGIYFVDASMAGIGKLRHELRFKVEDGYVSEITGKDSERLKKIISNFGKDGKNIAEFGIGTNEKAIVTGNVLEDEKAIGTCHIAIGSNKGFGGNIGVGLHLDGIIKEPTIYIDDEKIMEKGRFMT